MVDARVTSLAAVHFAELDNAKTINARLASAYLRERDREQTRRTHHFHGRFENTYVDADKLPELEPVSDFILGSAHAVLSGQPLRHGFWFNEMQPGQRTSLHSHEELDECLSAVYYVTCPADSGRLILHDDDARIVVTPRAGLLVMFPPDLPHEVEENASDEMRLSIAFNFASPSSAT